LAPIIRFIQFSFATLRVVNVLMEFLKNRQSVIKRAISNLQEPKDRLNYRFGFADFRAEAV
jgi:hypothetical protein